MMFNVEGKLYKPKTSQIVPYKPQTYEYTN
jgi:hypothetical protein